LTYYTNNVLLTGYWPPTNKMLRQFSPGGATNPFGWRGRNWRGRGFDIYAYFPEFAPELEHADNPGPGTGDLRVHYRDTLRDFRRITETHRPCAIVTFSRGWPGKSWEIEIGARNWAHWRGDVEQVSTPSPSPPDPAFGADAFRPSTLPIGNIEAAVSRASHLDMRVWIDETGDVGRFLSEYIAYLALWYQCEHDRGTRRHLCVAAGHIHVGRQTGLAHAIEATEITLEEVLKAVRKRLPTFWFSRIAFRVRPKTAVSPVSLRDVSVEIFRDGVFVARSALRLDGSTELARDVGWVLVSDIAGVHPDRTAAGPVEDEQLPMPRPPNGIEFSRGLQGHFECRLRMAGDGGRAEERVEVHVKECRLGAGECDPRHWGVEDEWTHVGSWTSDADVTVDGEWMLAL
jgi:hypothetical protein